MKPMVPIREFSLKKIPACLSWIPITCLLLLFFQLKAAADTTVSGVISDDTTWQTAGNPYIVTDTVTIDTGVTLTIEPGVVVRFNSSKQLINKGTLNAIGVEGSPVMFTSNQSTPSVSYWRGIRFSDQSAGTLDHCVIEYASSGIDLYLQTSPQIMNCTVRNNGDGFTISSVNTDTAPQPVIHRCSIYGNTSSNFSVPTYNRPLSVIDATNNWWGTSDPSQIAKTIYDYGDYSDDYNNHPRNILIDYSSFLDSENGSPAVPPGGETYLMGVTTGSMNVSGNYIVPAYFIVQPGHELTISPDTIIKFMADAYIETVQDAALSAGDPEGDPVVFTSWQTSPAAEDWKGMIITNPDTIDLKNTIVEYAQKGIQIFGGGSVQILETVIRHNQFGVEVADFNGTISRPVINLSSFYGNSYNYMVKKNMVVDPIPLDAKNNWWGTSDPSQIGLTIYDHRVASNRCVVDFSLFLDAEKGNPVVQAPTGETYLIGGTNGNTRLDGTYMVPDYYCVTNGFELTLLPGAILKFLPGSYLTVSENAVLTAGAPSMAPVTFTSSKTAPAPDDWEGIRFTDGSSGHLENCIIEYADYGVQVVDNSGPLITNCKLRFNDYGMRVTSSTGSKIPTPVVNYTSFIDNQQYDYYTYHFSSVILDARNNWWGTADPSVFTQKISDYKQSYKLPVVDFSSFLDAEEGSPVVPPGGETYLIGVTTGNTVLNGNYLVPSYYSVQSGHELSILPGSTIKFMPGSYLSVAKDGSLAAGDSQESCVVFTSDRSIPAPGDWEGLKIENSDTVILDNILVEYASTGILVSGESSTQIINSTIRYNETGIKASDITSINLASPIVNQCAIYENQDYNYSVSKYLTSDIRPVDATQNWWGTADPYQIGAKIYDNGKNDRMVFVDFSSFLDSEKGSSVTHAPTGEVYLIGGTVDNTSLDGDYMIPSSFSVISGHHLTILPGSTLKFMTDASCTILENATITAGASVGLPVTFTSALPDPAPGVWPGIRFNPNSSGSLTNCIVEYADNGLFLKNNTSPTIKDTKIRNNNRGIMGVRDYYYSGFPAPVVNQCYFQDNTEYNYYTQSIYYNSSSTTLNATGNFWGTANVQTISEKIYDFAEHSSCPVVDFSSFIEMNGQSLTSILQVLTSAGPGGASAFKYDFNDDGKTGAEDATYTLQHMAGLRADLQNRIYFNGTIASDLTLTLEESPFIVTENVRILPGVSVTIEPGVIIKFAQGKNLWVDGSLNAIGTEESAITFTSAVLYPSQSAWTGIYFNENSTGQISHTIIEYADRGIDCKNSNPQISETTFSNNLNGIYLRDASPVIQNCLIKDNGTGINCQDKSSPQISGNTIISNTTGIRVFGGTTSVDQNPHPLINHNSIHGNGSERGGYNISIEAFYDPQNQVIDLTDNWWGTIVRSYIQDGIYDISDAPTAAKGNVTTILDGPDGTSIPGELLITQCAVSREFINPAESETSLLSFHLAVPLNVTVELYKAMMIIDPWGDGTFERIYSMTLASLQPMTAGMHTIPWNGRDSDNKVVDHSAYVYVIKAFDGDELVDVFDPAYSKQTISIAEKAVSPSQYNPYANEDIEIRYELSRSAWVTIGGQTKLNPIFKGVPRGQGLQVEVWDGLNASGGVVLGDIGINMKAESMSKNAIVLQDNTLKITDVSSEPYVITPIYGEVSTVYYTLSRDAEISISLRDPNGGNWSLMESVPTSQGDHAFLWDGKIGSSETGKNNGPQGDYTLVITAYDNANNTTFTKHVNIHVYE